MIIRNFLPEDAGAIVEIYNHYVLQTTISFETAALTADAMGRRLAGFARRYPCLVCEDAGRIVGYAYAHAWKERAAYDLTWETTVYVAPSETGRKIGRRLMDRLVEDCRKRGAHALIACITADNAASLRLHEALGFERVSLFREVGVKFGRLLDVIDCELLLNG